MDAIEAYKMIHIIETVEDRQNLLFEDRQNLLFALPVTKKKERHARENWMKLKHTHLDPQEQD